jgi:multidrug efflux pump subunit AcrA (membrane-fusion protein)
MNGARDGSGAGSDRPKFRPGLRLVLQILLVVLFVGGGTALFFWLKSKFQPPARQEVPPVVRTVRVRTVEPEDRGVVITGHGTARAKYRISLVPQVAGKVIEVSPRLKAGHRVTEGTLLVAIEPDTYRHALDRARAEESRLEEQVRLLGENLRFDQERLVVVKRACALARSEFDRARLLLERDKVGSTSVVEAAEQAYLQRRQEVIALENSIADQPIRVAELRATAAGARAQRAQAELDLARTRITAPFDARVESADVQEGQVVGPTSAGSSGGLATLTDLRVLEIPVAADSQALPWLPITSVDQQGEYTFDPDAQVTVTWIQDPEQGRWTGRLARLEGFASETRTITLVVEVIDNPPVVPLRGGSRQLEEGMFCRVDVTGRTARRVFILPRIVVRQDRTVPVLEHGKLALRAVHVLRFQGDEALIDQGLKPGDTVVLSPLANPVPGMRLTTEDGDGATAGKKPSPAQTAGTLPSGKSPSKTPPSGTSSPGASGRNDQGSEDS